MQDKNVYDHTKDFKTECLKAIVQIKQFCMSHGIPFYMTFATSNNNKATEYITSKQLPPECDSQLTDDKFRRIVLAEHGFDIMLNHIDEFDLDSIPIPDICDSEEAIF